MDAFAQIPGMTAAQLMAQEGTVVQATRPQGDMTAAARRFEAMFLGQMLQPMWAGIGEDPMFGGGPGEETWRGMLINEYGNALAQNSNSGIADAMVRQLIQLQEQAHEQR